jgi:hypothetical protein
MVLDSSKNRVKNRKIPQERTAGPGTVLLRHDAYQRDRVVSKTK